MTDHRVSAKRNPPRRFRLIRSMHLAAAMYGEGPIELEIGGRIIPDRSRTGPKPWRRRGEP